MLITFNTFASLKKYADENNFTIQSSKYWKGCFCYAQRTFEDNKTVILGVAQ